MKLEEEFPGDYLVTPLSFLILSFSFQSLGMRIRQILFPLLWLSFIIFVARQFQLLGLGTGHYLCGGVGGGVGGDFFCFSMKEKT